MRLIRLSTEAGIRDAIRPSGGKADGNFDQERDATSPTPFIRQRLEEARSLAETMTAAYDAFDEMLGSTATRTVPAPSTQR